MTTLLATLLHAVQVGGGCVEGLTMDTATRTTFGVVLCRVRFTPIPITWPLARGAHIRMYFPTRFLFVAWFQNKEGENDVKNKKL